jgi:hypothetical protein
MVTTCFFANDIKLYLYNFIKMRYYTINNKNDNIFQINNEYTGSFYICESFIECFRRNKLHTNNQYLEVNVEKNRITKLEDEYICNKIKVIREKTEKDVLTDPNNEEICMKLAEQDSNFFDWIPICLVNKKICLAHTKSEYWIFQDIPPKYLDEEILIKAITNEPHVINEIPEDLVTENICMAMVVRDGYYLEDVPEKFINRKIRMTAILTDAYSICYVPKNERDYDMCMTAVTKRGDTLKFVPKHICDDKIRLAAIAKDGWAIKFVPRKSRTEEMDDLSRKNIDVLNHVVERNRILYEQYDSDYSDDSNLSCSSF